jgi:hypothetical protein
MHDRLTRLEDITEVLARSPLAKSGGVTVDELAMDAALADLLFEKKAALENRKNACLDKSVNSVTYNELLMSVAETVAGIRGFEFKYDVQLMV